MAGQRMTMTVIGKSPVTGTSRTIITFKGNPSAGKDCLLQVTALDATIAAAFTKGDVFGVYLYPAADEATVEAAVEATAMHPND